MTFTTTAVQALSISISLLGAGGIASFSLFNVPTLKSQPASRSLPSIRWLFSRGSHIFPQAAVIASSGFTYLAYATIPAQQNRNLASILHFAAKNGKVQGYLAAAVLTFGIAPFTNLMIPTNFKLIGMNEDKGGARSERSAKEGKGARAGERSAEDSVNGKGYVSQFTDLSVPQGKTTQDTSEAEDEEVRRLLDKFGKMNAVRAVLMASGGVVGLLTALA